MKSQSVTIEKTALDGVALVTIRGYTHPYVEQLKDAGALWNAKLACWTAQESEAMRIRNILKDMQNMPAVNDSKPQNVRADIQPIVLKPEIDKRNLTPSRAFKWQSRKFTLSVLCEHRRLSIPALRFGQLAVHQRWEKQSNGVAEKVWGVSHCPTGLKLIALGACDWRRAVECVNAFLETGVDFDQYDGKKLATPEDVAKLDPVFKRYGMTLLVGF